MGIGCKDAIRKLVEVVVEALDGARAIALHIAVFRCLVDERVFFGFREVGDADFFGKSHELGHAIKVHIDRAHGSQGFLRLGCARVIFYHLLKGCQGVVVLIFVVIDQSDLQPGALRIGASGVMFQDVIKILPGLCVVIQQQPAVANFVAGIVAEA